METGHQESTPGVANPELALSVMKAERDAWEALARSRGGDNEILRMMLYQTLDVLQEREQAERIRRERDGKRPALLLDDRPWLRLSVTQALREESQALTERS